MTSSRKELFIKTLNREETERPAWVPYSGVHSAYLIGKDADEFLMSADLMVEGFEKALELYTPDALPILFDLQLEAEALGCELAWAKDNPPAVATHILDTVPLSELKVPTGSEARLPIMNEAIERIVAKYDDEVAIMGLVTAPFTLGLHLMGAKIITKMVKKPDEVIVVMQFCSDVCVAMTKMYLDRGVKIIALVDPMASQVSPEFFDKFLAPSFQAAHDLIKEAGGYSLCFVCGNATRVVPNLAKLPCDGFAVDENIDFAYVTEEAQKAGKVYGGNLPLTVGLLFGEVEENVAMAKDNIQKGKSVNNGRGFILAPGCDMPYFCDPENSKAVVDVVYGRR